MPDAIKSNLQAEINGRLTTLVNRANSLIIESVNEALQDFELTPTQYASLAMLGCNQGISSAKLARLVNVTPQSMGTIVSKFEERALVTRQPAEIHSRVMTLTLTKQGFKLMQAADDAVRIIERRITGSFSQAEIELFKALLRRIGDTETV
ncbi:MarR family winged helix-turn-helix transcriptional regulator [Paenarthrobacter nitroguajacolicus]|uniref:MarR family winged helix-turn-helix transcriptional regulator n=1 Tax=Paenarthrobacter nitroguajacolicus TaxID=211146 RepID=UPI00248C176F|nr:MarR family transcriptional regulator [Paenarthrobacter nitroguajacolicus]MDI2036493.1 putative HTH-type transcriptional regulator [Paenarthrobacter nitroguajacolicus]